ncbi:hypothetical protein DFH09DRAFT_1067921 [Mycena vulgaris]|nr:hypothetical protein DFH09DRAFT_1067921 [Mycena vulgaris]
MLSDSVVLPEEQMRYGVQVRGQQEQDYLRETPSSGQRSAAPGLSSPPGRSPSDEICCTWCTLRSIAPVISILRSTSTPDKTIRSDCSMSEDGNTTLVEERGLESLRTDCKGIRAPLNSPVLLSPLFVASASADPVDVGTKPVMITVQASMTVLTAQRTPIPAVEELVLLLPSTVDSIKPDVAAVDENVNRPGLGPSIWATTPVVRASPPLRSTKIVVMLVACRPFPAAHAKPNVDGAGLGLSASRWAPFPYNVRPAVKKLRTQHRSPIRTPAGSTVRVA